MSIVCATCVSAAYLCDWAYLLSLHVQMHTYCSYHKPHHNTHHYMYHNAITMRIGTPVMAIIIAPTWLQ